jgi:hypothetical protein
MYFLDEQFRCRRGLRDFASKAFYSGQVKEHLLITNDPLTATYLKVTEDWGVEKPANHFLYDIHSTKSKKEQGGNLSVNVDFVDRVSSKVDDLLERREKGELPNNMHIMILCMYKGQVALYRKEHADRK